MESANKQKVAFYTSLCLLLSYAELLIPRFVPFLRLGLSNSIILLALDFHISDFLILLVFKSIASSFISGTLFSPFFLISFFQSVISGLLMYLMEKKLNKLFSVYGISIAGAGLSALVQVFCAGLYLGSQVYYVLWIMLLFSIPAGIITAFISKAIRNQVNNYDALSNSLNFQTKNSNKTSFLSIFFIIFIIFISFIVKNIFVLLIMLAVAIFFQRLFKRKISIISHLSLWIFILALSLFQGEGEVIFKLGFITACKNSIVDGVIKALKLSIVMAVSQQATCLKPASNSMLSMIIAYFSALCAGFNAQEGGILKRINSTLSLKSLEIKDLDKAKNNNQPLFITETLLFLILFLFNIYFIHLSKIK